MTATVPEELDCVELDETTEELEPSEELELMDDEETEDELTEELLDVPAQSPSYFHSASTPGVPPAQLVCDHNLEVQVTYSLLATQL